MPVILSLCKRHDCWLDSLPVAAGAEDDNHLLAGQSFFYVLSTFSSISTYLVCWLVIVAFLTDADLAKFSPRKNTEAIIYRMRMHAAWSAQMQVRMAELKSKLAEETSHRQMSHWDMDELKGKLTAAEETIARIAAAMGT